MSAAVPKRRLPPVLACATPGVGAAAATGVVLAEAAAGAAACV